jgi:hypothetical protein
MGVVPLNENIVAVVPQDKQVVVIAEEKIVSVSAPGPPGPQGPIGPAGGDVLVYDTNGGAINPWVITTNLGRLAHVTIVGDDGEERYANVFQMPPYNVVTIYFGGPFSGKALVG